MEEETRKRKQAFYEIGDGVFQAEAQAVYEKSQHLAMDARVPVTMIMKVVITPPAEGDRYGKTQFSISHTTPPKKSIEFTTMYSEGYAIKDGESVEGITQLNLELKNH